MPRFTTILPRVCIVLPLLLAGCASGSDPVHSVISGIGMLPEQPEAKDFVKEARPDLDKIDYLPVGFEAPEHKLPVRSKSEAAADDLELQKAAGQGSKNAASPQAKSSPSSVKPKKKPVQVDDPAAKPTQD